MNSRQNPASSGQATSSLRQVNFSSDGKTLASAYEDKIVKPWNLDLNSLMALGCNRVRNYLLTNPNLSDREKQLCSIARKK